MRYKNLQLVAQHEQICCVTSCEFATTFFNLQQTFLLRDKLITEG